jgi:hypothetical protein
LAGQINNIVRIQFIDFPRIPNIAGDDIIGHFLLGEFEHFLDVRRQVGGRRLGAANIAGNPTQPADGGQSQNNL